MSGADLFLDIQAKIDLLDKALTSFGKRGKALAEADKEYRIELSKMLLVKRDEGIPVSVLTKICEGLPEIAELRFQRDVADVQYSSAKEMINALKVQIKVLEEAIEREWHS